MQTITITITSPHIKSFESSLSDAFNWLFLMIAENKDTKFWFGSSDASIKGDLSLYINSRDFCKTIEEYGMSAEPSFNESFYELSKEEQKEVRSTHKEKHISPHTLFMIEFGNQLIK